MMHGSHFVEEQSGVRPLSLVFIYNNTTQQLWTVLVVHVCLPCNTAEHLWTVGLVRVCVFTVQHSRATVDSGTGTCVYLPCNTEQLWTVGLVHVYLLCSTAEQLWTVVLVHMCFSMQHRNCGQWYWYTRVYLPIPCNTATASGTDTRVYLLCNRAALDSLLVNGASIL